MSIYVRVSFEKVCETPENLSTFHRALFDLDLSKNPERVGSIYGEADTVDLPEFYGHSIDALSLVKKFFAAHYDIKQTWGDIIRLDDPEQWRLGKEGTTIWVAPKATA